MLGGSPREQLQRERERGDDNDEGDKTRAFLGFLLNVLASCGFTHGWGPASPKRALILEESPKSMYTSFFHVIFWSAGGETGFSSAPVDHRPFAERNCMG